MQYAKRFERICAAATLFAALCLFSIIPQTAFAYSANADEAKGLESMMSARNMGYMEGSELLLDWHGNPAYLIGYASDGYIIAMRHGVTPGGDWGIYYGGDWEWHANSDWMETHMFPADAGDEL